jgi:hypothetical protein
MDLKEKYDIQSLTMCQTAETLASSGRRAAVSK